MEVSADCSLTLAIVERVSTFENVLGDIGADDTSVVDLEMEGPGVEPKVTISDVVKVTLAVTADSLSVTEDS